MVDTMNKIPCPCGKQQEEVLNYEDRVRVGWYCGSCKTFTKALGRERKLRGGNDEKKKDTRRT